MEVALLIGGIKNEIKIEKEDNVVEIGPEDILEEDKKCNIHKNVDNDPFQVKDKDDNDLVQEDDDDEDDPFSVGLKLQNKNNHQKDLGKNGNGILRLEEELILNCTRDEDFIHNSTKLQNGDSRQENQTQESNLLDEKKPSNIKNLHGTNSGGRKKVKWYQCPLCRHQPFKTRRGLKNHDLSIHKPDIVNWLRCETCDYQTLKKQYLVDHIKNHMDPLQMLDLMFKCDKCPKMYRQQKNLQRHKQHKHEGYNLILLKCTQCDFETKNSCYLRTHKKEYHSNIEKLETLFCTECSYKTKFKHRLKTHRTMLHGDKYQCEKCSYQAASSNSMNLHMIGHKKIKEDEDLKYRCDKCDYKTFRRYSIVVHNLKHLKPEEIQYFYCYHCEFKAKRKDNLKTHILRHFKQNEVPFACFICDFTTQKRHLFFNHVDEHSKEANKKKLGLNGSTMANKKLKKRLQSILEEESEAKAKTSLETRN